MEKKIITTLIVFCLGLNVLAQESLERLLVEVEQSNTSLQAVRREVEAEKMGNRTGIFPHDPEVELFLLRETGEPGRRTDFHVAQAFDFPSVYGHRSRLANARNNQLETYYGEVRQEVLLKAHELYIDIVFSNALGQELQLRLEHARAISEAYEKMFEAGQTNLLELNKVRVNLINARQAVELNRLKKESAFAALSALNGGKPVFIEDNSFGAVQIPADFDQWYKEFAAQNPSLLRLTQEVEIRKAEERLIMSQNLPKFSAGFMRESLPGETFQGFGLGITIPLWENRNTVKYSRLRTIASESHQADALLITKSRLRSLYNQAIGLQRADNDYRQVLENLNNSELLLKALEAGEISLIEYLMELSFYYEAVNIALETQRSLHKAWAAMRHFTR